MSDYDENNDRSLKCGIIMVSKSCLFSLICGVCKEEFKNFRSFTKHVTEVHSYYDFDENPEEDEEMINYDDDDYITPAVEVTTEDNYNDEQDSRNQFDEDSQNNSSIRLPIMKYEDDDHGPLSSMFDDSLGENPNSSTGANGDGKMFPCKLCDKSYYYSSSLNKHVRKFHSNLPLSLMRPSSSTQNTSYSASEQSPSLANQERRRPNAPLHQCPKCPPDAEGFRTKRLLEQHNIEIHINARKFTCMFCPEAYNLKKDLTNHEQTMHLDKRPFRCDICSFAFKERKHLIRHERTHTGEKPFKCTVKGCSERFTRMDKKKHHMKKHEDGDFIPNQKLYASSQYSPVVIKQELIDSNEMISISSPVHLSNQISNSVSPYNNLDDDYTQMEESESITNPEILGPQRLKISNPVHLSSINEQSFHSGSVSSSNSRRVEYIL